MMEDFTEVENRLQVLSSMMVKEIFPEKSFVLIVFKKEVGWVHVSSNENRAVIVEVFAQVLSLLQKSADIGRDQNN